jgi:bla regulator protein BlaR1
MNLLDATLIRFLFASIGCLVAGVAVWGVLALARRYLPALGMQRTPWMLGQVALAATFIILMMPQAQQLHMLPVFDVDLSPATAGAVALPARAAGATSALAEPRSWLSWTAWAWALAYTGGLLWMLARLFHGQRALAQLLRAGAHLPADGALPFMIEVDAPVSPMLVGPFRPRLLLPLALRTMDPLQRDLIVAHELMHWRRGDLWWLAACALLQALCWFNPAMRVLRARLVWAQELGCDRDVLRGRPQVQRKAYAAALVAQLRFQYQAAPVNALAFGGVAPDTLTARRVDPYAGSRPECWPCPLRRPGCTGAGVRRQSGPAASAGLGRCTGNARLHADARCRHGSGAGRGRPLRRAHHAGVDLQYRREPDGVRRRHPAGRAHAGVAV